VGYVYFHRWDSLDHSYLIQMLYRNGAGLEVAKNQAPKEDSRQWADRENNRRLKRTQDDHNYIARHNYDNLIPA
jgi:hypothetical protein